MIATAIITTPRKNRTLKKTIHYLRKAGFNDEITIFSEPDKQSQVINGTYWFFNETQYGCFKNYTQALHYLVDHSDMPYVAVFSDDFKWANHSYRDICKKIEFLDGYLATYTPQGMKPMIKEKGVNKINEGWGVTWGGNYVFKKETAKKILEHPIYKDHYENYEKNQQIDHLVPKVCKELSINQYFHNPSFCDHIGFHSTIGHSHSIREKGLNFKG